MRGEQGDWRDGRGMIAQQDAVHAFDCRGALGAMLFVDPESREGAWLRTVLATDITIVPDARLTSSIAALRSFVTAFRSSVQAPGGSPVQPIHAVAKTDPSDGRDRPVRVDAW